MDILILNIEKFLSPHGKLHSVSQLSGCITCTCEGLTITYELGPCSIWNSYVYSRTHEFQFSACLPFCHPTGWQQEFTKFNRSWKARQLKILKDNQIVELFHDNIYRHANTEYLNKALVSPSKNIYLVNTPIEFFLPNYIQTAKSEKS